MRAYGHLGHVTSRARASVCDTSMMSPEQFNQVIGESVDALRSAVGDDWSKRALALDWTCRSTVDHIIDCVFSYAMQLAARSDGGFCRSPSSRPQRRPRTRSCSTVSQA